MKIEEKKLPSVMFGDPLRFSKYGVEIEIAADETEHLNEIAAELIKVFPSGVDEPIAADKVSEYRFTVEAVSASNLRLCLNGEKLFEADDRKLFFDLTISRIRLTVAEFAVGKVFLHAGVVGWKGKAIVIPAKSFSGKTTLVAELVKKGAAYYSDEYAVLDAEGNVEPFPKWLSMRGIIDDWAQIDCPVEDFGGTAAVETIPAAMVLIASYEKNFIMPEGWQPESLSQGAGLMEILPHTLPVRNNPKFVLEVLNKLVNRAIIIRTVRGEAVEFAEKLLGYFESQTK